MREETARKWMLFHVSVQSFPKITTVEGTAGGTQGLSATCPRGHFFNRIKVKTGNDTGRPVTSRDKNDAMRRGPPHQRLVGPARSWTG